MMIGMKHVHILCRFRWFHFSKKESNLIFHCSCAFPNTPKFTQVKQTGKGFIVNKQWILDCYKQKQLLSEKNYEFKGSDNNGTKKDTPSRTSERRQTKIMNFDDDEEEEYEKLPVSKDVIRKASIKKKMSTFDDDDDEDDEPAVSTNVKRKIQTKKKIATFDDDDEEPTVSKDVTKKITTSDDKDDGKIDSIHLLNMSRTG